MGLIPEDIVAKVLDRCDIVETIAGYIPLKHAGRNFKALCPFHHEKTPSFAVNADKQIFHCFGCGVGGNVISFIMQQEHMAFPEAVRFLAQKGGIEIPTESAASSQDVSLKEILFKVNELAADFFHNSLLVSQDADVQEARRYLKSRHIGVETVKKLKLGFAFTAWDRLLTYLRSKDISLGIIEKAGLIISKENRNGFHDRFRNRIIYPIFDIRSRCVGFGARAMQEGIAKYINSPETPVYTKGNHLYGLYASKEAVRSKDFVIIVEGYMDFITPFQNNVDNIAASLGTALTLDQIRLIRRYTPNIVMLFDSDEAGETAMVRSLDSLIEEGLNVKVATLASGEDPDSFIRKFGVAQFNEKITQALSLFDYKLKILMGRHDCKTVEGKARICDGMLPTVNRFKNAVIKFSYIKQLSETVSVSEQALLLELQKLSQGQGSLRREGEVFARKPLPQHQSRTVERNLLKLILEEHNFISLIKEEVELSDFQDEKIRRVVTYLFDLVSQGKEVNGSNLMSYFNDENVLQLISQLMASEEPSVDDKGKLCQDYIQRIKIDRLKLARQDLCDQIRHAEISGDHAKLEELKQKFNQLVKR